MPKRIVDKPSEEFDKATGIDYYNTKKGFMVLMALDNKLRKKIINLIHKNKRLTVEEIYGKLGISQGGVSQQLSILRLAKIVTSKQYGRYTQYSINYSRIRNVTG